MKDCKQLPVVRIHQVLLILPCHSQVFARNYSFIYAIQRDYGLISHLCAVTRIPLCTLEMSILWETIEGDLLALSTESGRSLPAIKEVVDKSLAELKSLCRISQQTSRIQIQEIFSKFPEEIVRDVKHKWLYPYIFACSHVGVAKKVLLQSLNSLQRLIIANVIAEEDVQSLVHVFDTQVRLHFTFLIVDRHSRSLLRIFPVSSSLG